MILYALIAFLFLRLFLPLLLSEHYAYVADPLSSLMLGAFAFSMGILFIIQKWIKGEGFYLSGFEMPIGLFLAATVVSVMHSADVSGSMLYTIGLIADIIYFYILIDVLNNKNNRLLFLSSMIAVTVAVIFFSLWEYSFHSSSHLHGTDRFMSAVLPYKRVGSLFSAPNILAGFLMLMIPLWGSIAVLAKRPWQKAGAIVLILLSLTVFLMTLSFLCTISLFLITLILAPMITKEWFSRSLGKIFWISLWIGGAFFISLILLKRNDFSFQSRLNYLHAAWLLLKDHPWLGWGIDTFRVLSPQYTYNETYSGYVHNSYLQIWLETGILSFAAMILWIKTFAWRSWEAVHSSTDRSVKIVAIALIWALSIFYFDNLTNFTMLAPGISFFGWMALAVFCAYTREEKRFVVKRSFLAALLFISALFLFKIFTMSYSCLNYQKAMILFKENNYPASYEFLAKAKAAEPHNQFPVAAQGMIDLKVYQLTHQRDLLDKAEEKFKEASRLSPYYYPNDVMLIRIAIAQGDLIKTKFYLNKLAKSCPSRYQTLQEEIKGRPQVKDLTRL